MQQLGEVEITLAGNKVTLRCTLRAARTVSNLSGGFSGAYQGLANFNLLTYATIVAAGMDKRGAAVNDVEEAVYETGLDMLTAPLSRFVGLLMNGGREPTTEDGEAGPKNG